MELVKEDVAVEEAEVDAYMDLDNAGTEGPSDDEQVRYLRARLENVRLVYKQLQLEKMEAEGKGAGKDMEATVRKAFSENYKTRKYLVTTLRRMGVEVEDRFIPNSAR